MQGAADPFLPNLPLRLTSEELASLLARPFDETAKRRLAETNILLVLAIVKRFPNIEYGTAIEVGIEGLVKAAASFKPEKRVKFSSYAAVCIINELRMHLRREKPHLLDVSIDSPVSVDKQGNELKIEDILADKDPRTMPGDLIDGLMDLRRAFRQLPVRDRELIRMRFVEGLTQKAIGNRLGWSQSYVSRKVRKALACLKKMMS
ncbi:MAG: sigma-70 family RNA polymerase sigma factor [Patescibacteria group bacterium]|nr:sigma-70 family RNA polymerase sigma factor [Patescibacteria group bacterium]MCL5262029.1 sigma-70 family RNA polymerase sigma factor [Patescibacteria group bacterium]